MPRKTDDSNQSHIPQQLSIQSQNNIIIDDEDDINEQSSAKKEEEIPDLTGIENEVILDRSNNQYIPERFSKCFIPQNEEAKNLTNITLKFFLCKKKYRYRDVKLHLPKEVYIISRSWYNKWKLYSKINTFKRIIKTYDLYESRPFPYTPKEKDFPGIIENKNLLIRNKKNDESRNILVSKYNNCLDTKLRNKIDFKLLSQERFDLLNDYFKSDIVLNAKKEIINDFQNYKVFSVHYRVVFLPMLAVFKGVNEENIENFKKNQNIIYDIYFKQSDSVNEIRNELTNILVEKPYILTNMGVNLLMQNNKEEISNHVNNFMFYIPKENNTKSEQELTDFFFTNETIEKIKKEEKISEDESGIIEAKISNINTLFHINWINSKDNIDRVENGIIFIEYIPSKDFETRKLVSIFEKLDYPIAIVMNINEERADRRMVSEIPNDYRGHHTGPYNLDNFPIDKEKNKQGLVGLNNLGNTCYMNTGLQCLSNCELLTKYFLNDYYKEFINNDNPIGSKGEIVEKYSELIHHLWYGNNVCVSPIQFKSAFGKFYNAFNGYNQQDSQEFISYLLDILHEDLNKVKNKPYIETKDLPSDLSEEEQFKIKKEIYMCRNQSLIADLIYGFYKSTVYCPDENCKNISKSFEPFNMITLPLVNENKLTKLEEYQNDKNKKMGISIINITYIPFKINNKPLRFPFKLKKGLDVSSFKKKIEATTGFQEDSYEIYKMQDKELICIKPDIIILEEFLKEEKDLYLFQIPPYVFGKPLDYFDNAYNELNFDHDKYYLEEEKYEGNDLYSIYNKEAKTDDDINNNNPNRINIDNDNNEEMKDDQDNDKEEKKVNKSKDDEDVKTKDDNLYLDRSKWVKAELYNYSYSNKKNKDNINEECSISHSRIIYINKEWDNTQIYICILEMLEGTKDDIPEIKAAWFQNLKEISLKIREMEKTEQKNEILNYFDKEISIHPLMLQYLGVYNCNSTNIAEKKEKWENSIFIFDNEEFFLKKILDEPQVKNELLNIELMFKIIWRSSFSDDYVEGNIPIDLEKSEKLEEIIKNQNEDEFIKNNKMENVKKKMEDKKNNNNNNLTLEGLLNNFNEVETLTKDNQWYCPKCKKFQLADKKMEIYSVNEVIVIHLKRFRNNRKNSSYVQFPIEGLNMANYLPNKNEKNIFDLFAVANHIGNLNGGHYFAYCKNFIDGEWYEFNDSRVSKINENSVVTSNAYVLFYRKRREGEEKINEEEFFKKPFIEIDYSKYINKK